MIIPDGTNLILATCQTNVRPAISNIFFDKGRLIATDGNILAVVEDIEATEEEKNQQVLINKDLFNYENKVKKLIIKENSVQLSSPCPEKFPNWRDILPRESIQFEIGINAGLLYKLSQAIGDEQLILQFHEKNKAIKVISYKNKYRWGLIMPFKIDKR